MLLNDIEFPLKGLTIVTDTPQLDSMWLLKSFENDSSLVVSFREPSKGIDLSTSLFSASGKFGMINLDDLAKQIRTRSPTRLILEHPDILVSSGCVSPGTLLDWIDSVSTSQVIVSLCVYPALSQPYPVTKATSRLIISLLHSANQQVKVSPLVTGYSSEYNGTIEIIAAKNDQYLFKIEKTGISVVCRS